MPTNKSNDRTGAKRPKDGTSRSHAPRTRDIRKIFGGARALGLDEETLRDLVEHITGQRSISKLTATERAQIIQDLQSKNAYTYKSKRKKYEGGSTVPGKKSDMITAAQQAFIEDLWGDLVKAGVENAASSQWRAAFTHRIIGVPWPQKKWEAGRLIEALKKRIKQG